MQQVGKYQLIRKLATGGMAEVYLAKAAGPRGFEKTLVLKRILPHLAEEAAFVEMFLSEAMLAARLTHPHIVQIFDFGEADGAYFLAMEYIDGPSLRTLVKRAAAQQLPLPTTLCARIIAQACEGLAFAHDFTHPETEQPLGLIHRDISPDNILLSRQGAAKVVDFGIAKAADQGHRTASGVIKGKIAYMPPEQLRAQALDRRVDVYALGVVLYELLTTHKPFESSSEVGLMQAILFEPAVPAAKHRPDLPEPLRAILARALAKERAQRYADCHELQADLEEFILSVGKPVTTQQVAQLIHHVSSSTDLPAVSPGVTVPLGPQMTGTPTHTPMPAPLMLGDDAADSVPTQQAPAQITKVEEFRPTPLEASLLAAMKTPVREPHPPGMRLVAAARAPEPAPLAPEVPTTQVRSPHAPAKPTPEQPAPVQPAPARVAPEKPVPARPVGVRNAALPARSGRGWTVAVAMAVLLLVAGGAVLWKTGTPPEPTPPPVRMAASAEPTGAPPVEASPPPSAPPEAAPQTAPQATAPAETAPQTSPPPEATPQAAPPPTGAEALAEAPSAPVPDSPEPVLPEPAIAKTGQAEPKRATASSRNTAKGTLDLRVRPYATVYVDGKKLGDTPLAPPSLSVGRHVVRLVNEEHGEKKYEITIEPNKPYVLKVNFLE